MSVLKTYQELSIHPEAVSPDEFLDLMKSCARGWQFIEEGATRAIDPAIDLWQPGGCFACRGGGQTAMVFVFVAVESDRLYVSNVVSALKDELSFDEYNEVLRRFRHEVVEAATEKAAARIELTDEDLSLRERLPGDAYSALVAFSSSASKASSVLRPVDRERWLGFLAAAHRGLSELDAYTLKRWLIEDQHFSPGTASTLASEYELSRRLLHRLAEGNGG